MHITANGSTVLGPGAGAMAGVLPSGEYILAAQGTFGGGTVDVEWSADAGTTWSKLTSTPLTSNGYQILYVINELLYRITIDGATSPSLYVQFGMYHARKYCQISRPV